MKGYSKKMIRKQTEAIAALLECPTLSDAAKKAGIGETTLWRWMKTYEFQAAYREARRRVVDSAINRLSVATTEAINVLISIMKNKKSPPNCRIATAKIILELSLKAIEAEFLEDRISALEKFIKERR